MGFTNNDSFTLGCTLARIAGHLEATSTDERIDTKTRLRFLQLMIDEFTKLDPNSAWIEKWENMKKEISA